MVLNGDVWYITVIIASTFRFIYNDKKKLERLYSLLILSTVFLSLVKVEVMVEVEIEISRGGNKIGD